uniref:Uncharacterized protein n=1 Tax=Arundo donax TaxID=35708 RepID=A0A0A8Z4G5_ARUDO
MPSNTALASATSSHLA